MVIGSDQGDFRAFFTMDSDFFTFQLFNQRVCTLCAAEGMAAVSQQPPLCSKMSFFNSEVKNNILDDAGIWSAAYQSLLHSY